MEAVARARYVRMSPQKVRLVVDLVRGETAQDALHILTFTRKAAARTVKKVLESAIANATHKGNIDVDTLYVKDIWVDPGPTWKRFQPRAMGRATRIRKRTSHITIVLDEA